MFPSWARASVLLGSLAFSIPAVAQDADNDGALDVADTQPCDPAIAGQAFAPSEAQHGLLLIEDHWPDRMSDEDFNDAALGYNFVYTMDASGRVTRVRATLSPLAAGGAFAMGLGFHLPIPRGNVQSITLSTGGGAPVALTPSAADAELTVQLVQDVATLFMGAPRPINSRTGSGRAVGQTLVVEVRLSTPVALFSASAPHDIYLFHTANPSHEVHRPQYSGTAAMDQSLFGTGEDGSEPGHWFVDRAKLPSAIVLPAATSYPREGTGISQLFPRIGAWAASGGTVDTDFYLNDTVTTEAYRDVNGLPPPAPATLTVAVRDVTCIAVDRTVPTTFTLDDNNVATYRGSRLIVPANATMTVNTSQPVELDGLDVAGTIVPPPCTASGACRSIDFRIARNVDIRSTGVIHADGRGYLGSFQAGNGSIGRGFGNVSSGASVYSGGTHGGYGGVSSGTPGQAYGDAFRPVLPGAGGTSHNTTDSSYVGGNGGGAIRINAGGTLTLNGRIRANGGRGGPYDSGGAGGSVWISANQITTSAAATTVLVQANGAYGYYSGGGGGRVAIYGTPAGTFSTAAMVQALGGPAGNYGAGGPGTIVHGLDQPGGHQLLVTTGSGQLNSNYRNTQIGVFGPVTAISGTTLTTNVWMQPNTLAGRTLLADAESATPLTIVSNTANTITVSGALAGLTAVGRNFCVSDHIADFAAVTVASRTDADLGCLTVSGTLRVQDNATVDLYRAAAGRFETRNTALVTAYDVTGTVTELGNSSRLTVRALRGTTGALTESAVLTGWAPSTTRVLPVSLTFATLNVATSARVTLDGLGYLGSFASGNGSIGRTNGNVATAASIYSGGSHGGYGGMSSGAPQMTYGDVSSPTFPGGGGTSHNTTDSSYVGGNGGGVLRVDVSGTFTLDGRITANGGRGGPYDSGGAGGSIWVTAGTLARTTTGLAVQSSGAYGYYSGGGGGRIALHYGVLGGTWAIDTASVQAYGGTAGNYGAGGSGTVLYRRTTEPAGRLLLSTPSGLVSNYARTRLGAFGTITALSGSTLTTSAPLEANALVGRVIRPDVESAATFTIASNTASTITVNEAGLAAATAVGRTFSVTDFHAGYDEVIVEGFMTVDLGQIAISGGLTVRGNAQVDFNHITASTVDVRDSTRLYGRVIQAGTVNLRNSTRSTVHEVRADNLAMTESAVLTGWAPTTTRIYPLTVTAGTMSMSASTTLHTDALGYLGSFASGNGSSGRTSGNVASVAAVYSGGSHGGYGGISSGAAAQAYGDPFRPVLAGAGGTSHNTSDTSYVGGNGGGVVRIRVTNDFTLNGRVSANGGRGGPYDSGGAGGSVWIDAGSITRSATGFAVEANGNYGYYSGGGGGRVALYYGALSGWSVSATTVRAAAGTAGNYGPGGAGTVVYQPASQARPNLLLTTVAGVNSNYQRTRLGAFGTVTAVSGAVLTTGTVLEPGTLAGRTLVANVEDESVVFTIVSNTASTITVSAPFGTATAVGARWYVRDYQSELEHLIIQGDADVQAGYLNVSGTAIVEATSDVTLINADLADYTLRGTATRVEARRIGGTTLRLGGASVTTLRGLHGQSITLDGTAVLTGLPSTTTAVWPVTVTADALTVGSSARFHVDGLGYLGSFRNGNGSTGRTNGNVASTAPVYSGGSHGGLGGVSSGTAMAVYGNSTQPITPGGGGTSHNTSDTSYNGGNGGGVIRVVVNGRFSHDGVIAANATRGGPYDSGGAGGSVWITAGTLAGAGRFEAQGTYGYYSGGGGGRISVQAGTTQGWAPSTTTMRVAGGTAGNYGAGAIGTTSFTGL